MTREARAVPVRCLLAALVLMQPRVSSTEPVAVRQTEGVVHGFLILRTLAGETLADGDLIQTVRGNRVTTRLVFHFRDGSLHDETTVFTQRREFRLVSDHLVQRGPTFPHALDARVDATNGHVVVRYTDDGKEKIEDERMKVPRDLANGLVPTLLKNLRPDAPPSKVSMLAATPKPRLVTLEIQRAGEDAFSVGGSSRKATRYVVKVQIGGVAGLLAPLVGQQPPDTSIWILHGEAPAFVRSEGPLYVGGPVWRIDLVSPAWPAAAQATGSH
jgi:hypothetical protein